MFSKKVVLNRAVRSRFLCAGVVLAAAVSTLVGAGTLFPGTAHAAGEDYTVTIKSNQPNLGRVDVIKMDADTSQKDECTDYGPHKAVSTLNDPGRAPICVVAIGVYGFVQDIHAVGAVGNTGLLLSVPAPQNGDYPSASQVVSNGVGYIDFGSWKWKWSTSGDDTRSYTGDFGPLQGNVSIVASFYQENVSKRFVSTDPISGKSSTVAESSVKGGDAFGDAPAAPAAPAGYEFGGWRLTKLGNEGFGVEEASGAYDFPDSDELKSSVVRYDPASRARSGTFEYSAIWHKIGATEPSSTGTTAPAIINTNKEPAVSNPAPAAVQKKVTKASAPAELAKTGSSVAPVLVLMAISLLLGAGIVVRVRAR